MSYFDRYAIEAKLDGSNWTDITADIIGTISCEYGIMGGGALDRIAGVGELKFSLNNTEANSAHLVGYYTPGDARCREGFDVGLEVRLLFELNGVEIIKWSGMVFGDGINVETGRYSQRKVNVVARDWMEQAYLHELDSPAFAEDKDMMEVIALIIANMPIAPASVTYYTAEDDFETVFDTVRSKTRAMSEFAKVVLSEMGYLYHTREGLIAEGRYTRNLVRNTLLLIPSSDIEYLLMEDGSYLLQEDGDNLLLDTATEITLDNSQKTMTVNYGGQVYNSVKTTGYPRRVDAAATTILFELNSPVEIFAGETVVLKGSYRDPAGIAKVSGIDMVAPVANTHYTMNANKEGSGSDLTSDLSVTAIYGTGDVIYELENTGASTGYVTLLKAIGKGVYIYDPVDYIVEDAASIALYGKRSLTIDMKYQDDPLKLTSFSPFLLDQYVSPRMILENATYIANRSDALLNLFMYAEPGDRIKVIEDVAGINGDYYIHGVRFDIIPGGIVRFTYTFRDAGFDTFNFAVWNTDDWDDGTTWGF